MTNQPAPSPDLLGARIRPMSLRAVREVQYQFIPAAEDTRTDEIVSVGVHMPPVKSQQFGSCVGHSVTSAAECLHNLNRMQMGTLLDPYVVYFLGRMQDNFYGEPHGSDTGLVIATGFDVSLSGIPRDDLWSTPASPSEGPPEHVLQDAINQDWLLGHSPLYQANPGGFVGGIWASIRQKRPLVLGMAWYNRWFDHHRILPDDMGGFAGHHAICVYAGIPASYYGHEELVVVRNSWAGYTDIGDLRDLLPEAEPGDVLIPAKYFNQGTVFEVRSASAEALTPVPFDDCRAEVGAAHAADERIVLRVRDSYRTQTARNALSKAAREIREQQP